MGDRTGPAQPGQKDEGGVGSAPVKVTFDKAQDQQAAYAQGEERPLGGYLLLMAGLWCRGAGAVGPGAQERPGLPERIGVADLALIGVATHKCTRLLAKDPVTSPLRAPFTTFKGTPGPAELQEEPRGTGLRKAVGELLSAPSASASGLPPDSSSGSYCGHGQPGWLRRCLRR